MRLALQLGVGDLVGPAAERGGSLDPFEEVAPAAPHPAGESALEHDLRAPLQRRPRRRHPLLERHRLPRDLDDAPARGLQPRQVTHLVGVAVALQQLRVLAARDRRGPRSPHPRQVQRRRVGASGEAHEVGGGEKYAILVTLHLFAPLRAPPPAGAPTCEASRPRLRYGLHSVTEPVIVCGSSGNGRSRALRPDVVKRDEYMLSLG